MIRHDLLKLLMPVIRDELVVCNIGPPSQELHAQDDQPTNFYMLGTMGWRPRSALVWRLRRTSR